MPKARPSQRKTARQKLDIAHPSHGRAFPIPLAMRGSLGRGTMIVPRPTDVEAAMRLPRKGRLITLTQIRARLARAAGVDQCCPLTTGIFARLASEAANEDAAAGKKRITPYWRTIRETGALIDRFPGGVSAQAARLRREGFSIRAARGRKPRVVEFESHLVSMTP